MKNNRFYSWLSLIFLLVLLSCGPPKRNEKVIREVFENTFFDSNVIARLPMYDSSRKILFENMGTIMKFRNSRNLQEVDDTAYYRKTGKKRRITVQQDDNDYTFFMDTSDLPMAVFPRVDSIVRVIGRDRIMNLGLGWQDMKDPVLWFINIKRDHIDDQRTLIFHELNWHKDGFDSTDLSYYINGAEPGVDKAGVNYWFYPGSIDMHKAILVTPKWKYTIRTARSGF